MPRTLVALMLVLGAFWAAGILLGALKDALGGVGRPPLHAIAAWSSGDEMRRDAQIRGPAGALGSRWSAGERLRRPPDRRRH